MYAPIKWSDNYADPSTEENTIFVVNSTKSGYDKYPYGFRGWAHTLEREKFVFFLHTKVCVEKIFQTYL